MILGMLCERLCMTVCDCVQLADNAQSNLPLNSSQTQQLALSIISLPVYMCPVHKKCEWKLMEHIIILHGRICASLNLFSSLALLAFLTSIYLLTPPLPSPLSPSPLCHLFPSLPSPFLSRRKYVKLTTNICVGYLNVILKQEMNKFYTHSRDCNTCERELLPCTCHMQCMRYTHTHTHTHTHKRT